MVPDTGSHGLPGSKLMSGTGSQVVEAEQGWTCFRLALPAP